MQWENPAAYANAERQLTEMITRDRNRASVVFWCVANETPLGDARTKFLGNLAAKVRELDTTRLVTAATLPHRTDPQTITDRRSAGQAPRRAGLQRVHRLVRRPARRRPTRTTFKSIYDKPLIMSEFGAEAPFGRHGDDDDRAGPRSIRPTSTVARWPCCSASRSCKAWPPGS